MGALLMFRSVAFAAVLSGAMFVTSGGSASAGFHHRAKAAYPAYAACAPCMVIAGGCGTRDVYGGCTIAPCQAPERHRCGLHHFAKACAWRCMGGRHARRGGCGDGCGSYGACGYGGCGNDCGGDCGNGGCGGDCTGGCGAGGCGNSGCAGCGSGSGCSGCDGGQVIGGQQGKEEIIYDGPAGNPPAPPEPAPANEASTTREAQYRLVGQSTPSGAAAFDRGLASFRGRSLTDALQSFEAAANAEPANAIYHYYKALTLYDLHGAEAGDVALQQAIELEQREAVPNWGKRMERVQGRSRVWIEKARREAGLAR